MSMQCFIVSTLNRGRTLYSCFIVCPIGWRQSIIEMEAQYQFPQSAFLNWSSRSLRARLENSFVCGGRPHSLLCRGAELALETAGNFQWCLKTLEAAVLVYGIMYADVMHLVVSLAATHKQVSRIFHSRETMGVVTKEPSASLATFRLERERELYNTIFQGTSDPWLFFVTSLLVQLNKQEEVFHRFYRGRNCDFVKCKNTKCYVFVCFLPK